MHPLACITRDFIHTVKVEGFEEEEQEEDWSSSVGGRGRGWILAIRYELVRCGGDSLWLVLGILGALNFAGAKLWRLSSLYIYIYGGACILKGIKYEGSLVS